MELLDLPLEIFRLILKEVVLSYHTYGSLELRLVSRVFDHEALEAVFLYSEEDANKDGLEHRSLHFLNQKIRLTAFRRRLFDQQNHSRYEAINHLSFLADKLMGEPIGYCSRDDILNHLSSVFVNRHPLLAFQEKYPTQVRNWRLPKKPSNFQNSINLARAVIHIISGSFETVLSIAHDNPDILQHQDFHFGYLINIMGEYSSEDYMLRLLGKTRWWKEPRKALSEREFRESGSIIVKKATELGYVRIVEILIWTKGLKETCQRYESLWRHLIRQMIAVAVRNKNRVLIDLFIKASKESVFDVLSEAAKDGDLRIVRYVIKKRPWLAKKLTCYSWGLEGWTTLEFAAFSGNIKLMKYLIRAYRVANDQKAIGLRDFCDAIAYAVANDQMEMFNFLVKDLASTNRLDSTSFNSILHIIGEWGRAESLQLLLDHGVSVSTRDSALALLTGAMNSGDRKLLTKLSKLSIPEDIKIYALECLETGKYQKVAEMMKAAGISHPHLPVLQINRQKYEGNKPKIYLVRTIDDGREAHSRGTYFAH